MNTTVTPPGPRPSGDRPPDDIDRLLGDFFRAELPRPWPRLRPPPAVAVAGRNDPLPASRLVLAVSLAAVLAGGWLLGSRLTGPSGPSGSALDGSATRPPELRGPVDGKPR